MLIDSLVADGAPGSGCDIACLIPALRGAQKFALAPEFAAVAEGLSLDYSGLVRTFPHCRIPFPVTWIEVAHKDRPMFAHAEMQAPDFQIIPRRVGFLLQATRDDLSAWHTHLFWSSGQGNSCAALAMDFDLTHSLDDRVPSSMELRERKKLSPVIRTVTDHPGWVNANDEVKRLMLNHTQLALPDYGWPAPHGLEPDDYLEFYRMVGDLARSDWAGEPAYLLAVVGMMNARNVVDTETVDNSEYNRKR